MNLSLSNKNAIVCGSTQGIGKCIAQELAQMGANITLIARNETALEAVKKELTGDGHDYIVADFTEPEQLKSLIEEKIKNKNYHILVNNTGGPAGGPILNADIDSFMNAYNMHLVCNHILVQALVEGMKEEGFGRIINIISTSVKQPLKGLGVSNTTRGAVASWAKTLASELGPFNITVNNVLPGATNTVRLKSIISNKASKTGDSEEKVSQQMLGQIPMDRFAEPEEIANVAAFLASPAAGYVNGVSIPVDGGRTTCF